MQTQKNVFQMFGRIFIMPIVFIICICSCSDLLVENPTTFYNQEVIFDNDAGVESAVNGIYYALGAPDYYGNAWHNFVMPMSGVFHSSQIANRDATGLNATPSNPNLTALWSGQYRTINAANVTIDALKNTTIELNNKNEALGHAYFVRGLVYLDLVRFYGDVPLRLAPANLEQLDMARTPRSQVVEQIISDLNNAKELMPQKSSAINNRPGKLAANVLLAKLYMFLGSESDNLDYWQDAFTELQQVINADIYRLNSTYAQNFEPFNENTVESILEIQYSHTGIARNSDIVRLYTPGDSFFSPENTTTFGRIRPNKEVFDAHVAQYPDDPRINTTFIYDFYETRDGEIQEIYPTKITGNNGYPVIAKWFDPSYNNTTTERNYILIRYADVLLMMAETQNELEGPENAYQYVNQVLVRARDIDGDGISDSIEPANYESMTQEEFRSRIMKERMYELLSEGHEWVDTRRRGYNYLLENVIQIHNSQPNFDTDKDFMYPEDIKNMLLPIPITELSGNQLIGPEDQNPGY